MSLQALREARGWSRAELARRAGMNATTVGQIESGRFRPYTSQLEKLARAFSVSASQIDLPPSAGGRKEPMRTRRSTNARRFAGSR